MLRTVEGVYENGSIKLSETPEGVSESRVIVTFLEAQPIQEKKRRMTFGMLADPNSSHRQSTEEDFRIAEFQDDADDELTP